MPLNNFNRHISSLGISHWIIMVSNRFNPSGWLLASMSVYGLNDGEEEKKRRKKDEVKVKRERKKYIWKRNGVIVGGRLFFLACWTYKLLIFPSQIKHLLPHFGYIGPTKVQIPRALYEQKIKWENIPHHSMFEQKL